MKLLNPHVMKRAILLLSTPLLINMAQAADDADALRQQLTSLTSLYAQFEQQVLDINGRAIQNGQGIMALATPNKLYWHLQQPDESLIVADGNDVWLYNPFAEEVTVMDMAQIIDASPIALLVQTDPQIWQNYQVQRVSATDACYQVKPKQATQIEQVNLCFANNGLSRFSIADTQGNTSHFTLSQGRPLQAQEQGMFSFVLPEGTDIDDQRMTPQL